MLGAYLWPGNVRELRNVIYAALVEKSAGEALPRICRGACGGARRLALEAALRRTGGNAAEAARVLGEVGRGAAKDPGGTVRTMMKRLGLGRAVATEGRPRR